METKTATTAFINNLLYLPHFASFLLHERLEAFVQRQLHYAYELEVPLLKFFLALPEEQRIALSRQTSAEFLEYLATNNAEAQIESAMRQWMANQLPVVHRDAVESEDILLVNYMRKKAMLDLLPDYTKDPFDIIELVKEIDFFILQSISAATRHYMALYKQRLEENSHFIQKVAETIPGAVYVFDALEYKGIYSNNKLAEVIGYAQSDLNAMGQNAIAALIHPDDQENLKKQLEEIRNLKTDEPALVKYRIRKKDGGYKWLANYESVFKRKDDGALWQTIGITLDVDAEQKASEELHEREQQLLEAQNIAQLGNYYWDFNGKESTGSAKTFELLAIEKDDVKAFMANVHPADRKEVKAAFDKAMNLGVFSCEFRIRNKKGTRNIWSRGVVQYKDDKPVGMSGTVMDITDHNLLLQKLAEADHRHKHTEALAHIGTYAWNVVSGEVEWSDEMYRIYETPADATLSYETVLHKVYPDDKEMFDTLIRSSVQTGKAYDFYYRIVTNSGRIKILHTRGSAELNDQAEVQRIVGTDQDVTEKQTLIRRLQKSESLYKQAEEIADMGNWSWDMRNGKLEWTDQLYRIYGLEPQSEEITNERFLAFVHPDDREAVAQGIDKLNTEDVLDYTFRIVTGNGTEKWLRSIAQVLRNDEGKPAYVIGTEQDVSEKESLINRLKESEQLYKQAQSLTHMGNWTHDLQTKKTTWSEELFAIYEQPPGEPMTTDEWTAILDQAEAEKMFAQLDAAITQGKPIDIIHRVHLPSGKTKVLHRRGEVVYDNNGKPVKMVGTTQDVTEQMNTQAELRDSQIFIQKITDATPSIIALYNVNTGRYTYISEGLEKLLGYTTKELMDEGTSLFMRIVHPEDLELVTEKNRRGLLEANADPLKKDLVTEFTYRMQHKDESYRWFHTYGTVFDTNADGKVEHVLNITLDVTEQKEAVETIREQEYFIQQIADASPTILYLFDVTTQSMAYINREAFFVLGYLPEEILEEGSKITALLYHPDDLPLLPARKQSKKNFQQVDSMIQYECRMKHKDGDYRWLLVREIVFKSNDSGGTTQIIGAALDITRRKDMERTILQNTHQLEQSNASLEEFAYVASHDLKEPLRKISTFGDRLVASQMDRLSDDGKIYLNKIVDASQRMQNMISDLLSISMISGNKGFEKWSLQKILEETLQTLEYKIEQQKAVIRYSILPDAAVVPSQFRQLFQNLISNSLKFVRDGVQPVITIESKTLRPDEVTAYSLRKAPAYLQLRFSDNGIGFENEYAQKIFAIFQRLHGRSEYEGSGIGLAICKKIAEHHGGVIFASGQPGLGASFTLILPA